MHPKFYYFDVGVYRILRPRGPLDIPDEMGGIALESLFLQELRAINDYYQHYYQLFFWRTGHGLEVDFVAYGDKGFCAFEIKSRAYVDNKDIKGLQAFASLYPECKLYLIYRGSERLYMGNIMVLPIDVALLNLPEILAGTFGSNSCFNKTLIK
jgi:predicted AAA+ superfamily ATPase